MASLSIILARPQAVGSQNQFPFASALSGPDYDHGKAADGPLFLGSSREGGHDFPVGVVKRGPHVLDRFAAEMGALCYDGFVSFSESGALSGLKIRFEDVAEGARFAEQFVKLTDAFKRPFQL